jgi:PKHD-type hydroxylase
MTHYIFAPAPTRGYGEHAFTTWLDGFSDDEIKEIIRIGDLGTKTMATLDVDDVDPEYRTTEVSWIHHTPESDWLYGRIAHIIQNVNSQFYGFDIHGLCESLQFTVYTGDNRGHYDWHQDGGANTNSPRKLSIVIQLSDPADYEGGDLEILTSRSPVVINKQKGLAAVFPSYVLHRVTPVTKGIRKTLVAWITGPKFR